MCMACSCVWTQLLGVSAVVVLGLSLECGGSHEQQPLLADKQNVGGHAVEGAWGVWGWVDGCVQALTFGMHLRATVVLEIKVEFCAGMDAPHVVLGVALRFEQSVCAEVLCTEK